MGTGDLEPRKQAEQAYLKKGIDYIRAIVAIQQQPKTQPLADATSISSLHTAAFEACRTVEADPLLRTIHPDTNAYALLRLEPRPQFQMYDIANLGIKLWGRTLDKISEPEIALRSDLLRIGITDLEIRFVGDVVARGGHPLEFRSPTLPPIVT